MLNLNDSAAICGAFEILEILVEHGAGPLMVQKALAFASAADHYEKIKYLLLRGASADGPPATDAGRDPILPVRTGDERVDRDQLWEVATPLVSSITQHWALASSNPPFYACFTLLLENGACPSRVSFRDYLLGDEHEINRPKAELLTGRTTTALLTASYFGRLDMIRALIERGVDVNFDLGEQNLALTHALRAEGYVYDKTDADKIPDTKSITSSLQTRATLQLLISLGADKTLCTSKDQDRIDRLLNMSAEQVDEMVNLQKLVEQYPWGKDMCDQKSFHHRRDELRMLIKKGAGPTLCCTRNQKRVQEFLSWTEEELDALDMEWSEERAMYDMSEY